MKQEVKRMAALKFWGKRIMSERVLFLKRMINEEIELLANIEKLEEFPSIAKRFDENGKLKGGICVNSRQDKDGWIIYSENRIDYMKKEISTLTEPEKPKEKKKHAIRRKNRERL